MKANSFSLVLIASLIIGTLQTAKAQEIQSSDSVVTGISGPASVAGQMARDAKDEVNILPSYFAFKKRLKAKSHFNYTVDYWSVFQGATAGLAGNESTGYSGIVRAFGTWDLAGRKSGNTGTFIFKFENRHRYNDHPTPQDLGFNVGYAGLTAVPFSGIGWAVTNFFWQQSLLKGKLAFQVGLLDPADYTNVYGLVDPWNDFYNLAFSTGVTIPLPNQGIGLSIRGSITDNLYVLGGISDANGDPTDPFGMFDSFFGTGEYFTQLEVGWAKSYAERFSDNIHLFAWHADARQMAMTPEGWGMAFSFNKMYANHWLPFVRAGYAKDGGTLWQKSFETGLGYHFPSNGQQVSIGFSWGQPSESTLGEGLRDQYTMELYYRLHLIKIITLTPDIQLLINPALNPDKNFIAVFGLRGRVSL